MPPSFFRREEWQHNLAGKILLGLSPASSFVRQENVLKQRNIPRTGLGGIPRSGCGGIPCTGVCGRPCTGCGGTPRSGCGGIPRSWCGCTLCSKQVARCALSIRAAVLETYQYRCSKSADSRALSNTPRCFFIKFSDKENLKRTANRIVYVKSNLPVRLALCRGSAPLGAEVVPRSVQR